MRKIYFTFLLCLCNLALAQQTPTGTPHPNVNYNDWFRGGNSGNNLSPNIFGTRWNSPIYTQTASATRTKLNGNFTAGGASAQYPINGYGFGNTATTINTSGYMLIGADGSNNLTLLEELCFT